MNHRFKLLVGFSVLAMACSTATPLPDPDTDHTKDAGGGGGDAGDDDDDDDAGATMPTFDASTTDAAPSQDASPKADAAPKQASCSVTFGSGACEACFAENCSASCDACSGDAACNTALLCIAACTSESCDSACLSGLDESSLSLLENTLGDSSCFQTTCANACAPPATAKVGDACLTSSQCISGVCSTGGWCEPASECFANTDCGIDSEGDLVWCAKTSNGSNGCFPGCNTTADCASYPGASCLPAVVTNGYTENVCQN